jgi:hypothetical protein
MRVPLKRSPRAEYRLLERERVNNSVTLAQKFPSLKALTASLIYFDRNGQNKTGEMRYKVNVQHAKSVFSFSCPSQDCARGDFDLSETVAKAVGARRKVVEGEMRCRGTRTKANDEQVACHSLLHYKMTFGYV